MQKITKTCIIILIAPGFEEETDIVLNNIAKETSLRYD